MPLSFHDDNYNNHPLPNTNSEDQKLLNIFDEESCYYAYKHEDATHIRISSDLTHIEDSAFRMFSKLRQVMIPGSVKSIGNEVFADCKSLREIFLPDSIEWIGCEAFAGCSALTTVHLPYGITEIDCDTFLNCSSLREIFLPPSVERIGDGAFAGCENLEAVYGGEGLITIESEAFFGCRKLRHLTLSSAVCSVADDAFANSPFCLPATYYGLKSPRASYGRNIIVPDGVRTIGACAFSKKKAMQSITLPDSVRNISRCAFDTNFSNLSGYHSAVTEDMLKDLPQEMNMPAGYLRQQTPYDAMMALALCDSVWEYHVTDADYEAMALYCDDPDARYLVMRRLSLVPGTHLEHMMRMSRPKIDHLTHLAEYLCMYFPILDAYHDDTPDIVRELHKEATERGAHDAARLLERYCLYPELFLNDDGCTGLYECFVSPFEAKLLLGHDFYFPGTYIDETQMHFVSSGHSVPVSFIYVILAEYIKPKVLRTLTPYNADTIPDFDSNRLAALIQQIEEDEWIAFLNANEARDRNVLELLCICADEETLIRLYERYSANTADLHPFTRLSILIMLYSAVRLNDSDYAHRIGEQLKRDIEQAKQDHRDHSGFHNAPAFTEELWDEAERWRFLNELDEDYPFEREDERMFRSSDDRDMFGDADAFADDDGADENILPQLDDDEWIDEEVFFEDEDDSEYVDDILSYKDEDEWDASDGLSFRDSLDNQEEYEED